MPADRELAESAVLSSVGAACARLIGALGGVLAARALGPAGRGQLSVLLALSGAGMTIAVAGLQFWAAREVARVGGVRGALSIIGRHAALITLLVPIAGFFAAPLIESLAHAGRDACMMATALTLVGALNLLVLAAAQGLGAMGVFAAAAIASSLVYLGVALALLASGSVSVAWMLGGAVAGRAASAAVALRFLTQAPREPIATAPAYRQALAFGLPSGASELVLLGMLRLDVPLVAAFLPLQAVGLYAVATALTELLWVVADGVALVVLPATARNPARAPARVLLPPTLAVTILGGALLTLIDHRLIAAVFGPAFIGAAAAVPLLVAAAVGGCIWKVIAAEAVARGHPAARLASALAGLVTMVAVDLVALPALGITGAALGAALGYACAAAVVSWGMRARPSP